MSITAYCAALFLSIRCVLEASHVRTSAGKEPSVREVVIYFDNKIFALESIPGAS